MKGTELGLNFFDLRPYHYFPGNMVETLRLRFEFEVRGNSDPSLMVGEVELLDLDVR